MKPFLDCCCCDLKGGFFFANAGNIGQKIRLLVDEAQPKVVVLDFRAVFDLEYSALKALSRGKTIA